MKTQTLLVLGVAGAAAWWLLSEKRTAAEQEACRQRGSEFVWYKGMCIDVAEYEAMKARGE
jgi:hypothetical protein